MIARYVNWDLVRMRRDRLPDEGLSEHVERLLVRSAGIRGRPSPRWEEMTDAEVGEAVGLTEEAVRALEDRCASEAIRLASIHSAPPDPDPGGG